jgi:hypothetical protein
MPGYALQVTPASAVSAPLWRALRSAAAPATVRELHTASCAHPNAIQHRLKRWTASGFVDVLPPEPPRYEISAKGRDLDAAPTTGSLSADAWQALRRLDRPVTHEELVAASGCADRPLYCRLRRWCRSGWIRKIEAQPKRFALSADAPDIAEPPKVSIGGEVRERRRSARERLWAAMRVLKRFDLPMLMMTAEAKRRSCEDFINLLSRAGYVRRVDMPVARAGAGNLDVARTWSTYVLVRNTGPKAPTITNPRGGPRQLVDGNNGASVPVGRGVRQLAREVRHAG